MCSSAVKCAKNSWARFGGAACAFHNSLDRVKLIKTSRKFALIHRIRHQLMPINLYNRFSVIRLLFARFGFNVGSIERHKKHTQKVYSRPY